MAANSEYFVQGYANQIEFGHKQVVKFWLNESDKKRVAMFIDIDDINDIIDDEFIIERWLFSQS